MDLPAGFAWSDAQSGAPSAAASDVSLPEGFSWAPAPQSATDKLTGTGGDRYQTWPERLLRGIGSSVASGVTLPHDVMTGQAQIPSSGAVPGSVPFGDANSAGMRVADLAGLAAPISPVSRMGGGWMTGLPAEGAGAVAAMPPALEANIAARNIGVDLPKAIGTDSPFTRFMGQVSNKMPGGGPMQDRIGTALSQTGDALANAGQMAGGAADSMAAGQGFKTGIEESFKPTIKARVGEAYDAITQHIDPNFSRPLDATQGAIADIVARRVASGEADPGKAIKTVLGGATRPGGLTFEGVKDLRTRVGEMLDTGIFPEGMSQHELRRVYGSLSDDLKATVEAAGRMRAMDGLSDNTKNLLQRTYGSPSNDMKIKLEDVGGDKAMAAFNKANALNKFAETWKDNLGKVLGTDRSGEGITSAILRMANNGPTGDLKALTMARAAVSKPAWQDVASTAVSSLGKDRKGDFSPAIFLNDFAKLSDRGKQLLFGDVGSSNVLSHLNDIATVSKKFVEAGKLANTSGTAGHNAAYTMLGGGAAGLLHGSLIEPVTALTTVVGNNLMARALSRPASAAAIARWTRAYDGLASSPDPKSLAVFNIAGRNLANTVNGQFGANVQPSQFLRAIQTPAIGSADQDQQGVPGLPAQ